MEWYHEDVAVLAAEECWALLGRAGIGRLAVVVDGAPEVFPVNYAVEGRTAVFRSAEGTKTAAALEAAPVALEADGYDEAAGRAWSVLLKGRAEPVPRGHALFRALELPLYPLQAGIKDRFVRIVPTAVTGRRFPVVEPGAWESWAAAGRRTATGSARWTEERPDRD